MSQGEAAKKLGIPRTTLRTLLNKREEIVKDSGESSRKRRRSGKDPSLESAIVQWIGSVRDKNAPLSGPLVMEKAEDMAKKLDKDADLPIPSADEMRGALALLKRGLDSKDFDMGKFSRFEKDVQKALCDSLKQSTIDRFLGKHD